MAAIEDRIHTVDDVAKLWGITPGAVRTRLARGTFPVKPEQKKKPGVKYGRQRLEWLPGKLRRYLNGETIK